MSGESPTCVRLLGENDERMIRRRALLQAGMQRDLQSRVTPWARYTSSATLNKNLPPG